MADTFVSIRRPVQVAAVAVAVARTENWALWEALVWLAGQVELGTLAATLYVLPRTGGEEVQQLPLEESRSIWRVLATKARRGKSERNFMPTAASTYSIHSADLARFIETGGVGDATAETLVEMARSHGVSAQPIVEGSKAQASVPTPAKSRVRSSARRDVLAPAIERAQKSAGDPHDVAAVWGQLQLLAAKKEATLFGTAPEGVQYLDGGEPKILTRRALAERIRRSKSRAEGAP